MLENWCWQPAVLRPIRLWHFARLRPRLLAAAIATRQPASVVRHAQLRLLDLTSRATSLCVRASAGRLDVADGQLRSVHGALRDAEWTLCVLVEALIELGGTHAIARSYTSRVFSTSPAASSMRA